MSQTSDELKKKTSENMEAEYNEMKQVFRTEIERECLSQLREELEAEAIVNVSPDLPVVPLEIILTLIDNLENGELNTTT